MANHSGTYPPIGSLLRARGREWLVEGRSEDDSELKFLELACIADDAQGEELRLVLDSEIDVVQVEDDLWKQIALEGSDNPEVLGAHLRAVTWRSATAADRELFQAPFRAGIRLEPYQLLPLSKALKLPRVNLLIADDVGLGKTVEAGLVLREMLLRRRVDYVVVSAPAAMTGQWQDELTQKFGLNFTIIDREYLAAIRRSQGFSANPWRAGSRFIISHSLLSDETYANGLKDALGEFRPRAMLILDEAHHAAPASGVAYATDSQFTRAVRGLAARFEHRLFLSATPHNGHSNSFSSLLELLDPQRFMRGVPVTPAARDAVMVRRLKSDLLKLNVSSFPKREVEPVVLDDLPPDTPELVLASLLQDYRAWSELGLDGTALGRARFLFSGLQQRLFSSIPAFARTLRRHLGTLKRHRDGVASDHPAGDAAELLASGAAETDYSARNDEEQQLALLQDQDDELLDSATSSVAIKVLPIRDGAILRILEGLMTLEAKTISGEKVRERLSYRSLDVEQIGSVYETVMGFTVMRAPSPMIAVKGEKNLPVFVDVDTLANSKGADRQKLLKEVGVAPSAKRLEAIKKANDIDELKLALQEIREERGSPGGHVFQKGAPVLQPTDERRRSGSHYTPRSLTEPIVRHVLEPAFERIGEAATPDQVLEIKVCDPACGSGAFLVEASRQLGVRLEKAWARYPELKPAIPPDEEDDIHARRLVAQRCLYGVDKNPMAVDLARLSLWLATLAREHEFTFLDHAIKCGDSLVGFTKSQIQAVNWDTSKPGLPLLRGLVRDRVNEVVAGRREIQFAADDVSRAIQESRHKFVEKKLEQPRAYGDAVIAAFFSSVKPKEREKKRVEVESLLAAGGTAQWEKIAVIASAFRQNDGIKSFHWELEFPEVFARDNPGFDGIVGNPPFLGGSRISTELGDCYRDWLLMSHSGSHGNADLVAHFFRQAFVLLRVGGCSGLIATNTIGQGDTRSTGLQEIVAAGGSIARALKRVKWPGEAAVVVSTVHIIKGPITRAVLGNRSVEQISPYLVEGDVHSAPYPLVENGRLSFAGSKIYGSGFTFDDAAAQTGKASSFAAMNELIEEDASNKERIFPYIGGDDINSSPTGKPERYVIDFGNFPLLRSKGMDSTWSAMSEEERRDAVRSGTVPIDYPSPVAADWPKLLAIVESLVKPERQSQKRKAVRERWWQYEEKRPGLYGTISKLNRVLAITRHSHQYGLAILAPTFVYADSLVIFAFESAGGFATMQSRLHELWARFFSSTLEDRLRYAPSDCFETFPFPLNMETDIALATAGQSYDDHRAGLMLARKEGMTKTYNRFHDVNDSSPDIMRLRELHAEMDRSVLCAYGWYDLAERSEARFLNEQTEDDHTYQGRLFWPAEFRDVVLARLLKLNADRHAEETRLGLVTNRRGRLHDEEAEDNEEVGD